MKVLVCGGRNYHNPKRIFDELNALHSHRPISLLIHGGAAGADHYADSWAQSRGVQPVRCDALWGYYRAQGKLRLAGPKRNAAMILLKPDLVIAFPGGTGTANMMELARQAHIPVREYTE
jgi:hypothetical protein